MTPLRPLWIAIAFLTRLPAPSPGASAPQETGRSLITYPFVGAIIGTLLVLFAALTSPLPNLLQATLIVAAWVAVTGALHIDGLADSADAWVGGLGSRARTLEIMKDPCCGPVGVAAVVLLLLLKVAAVTALLEGSTMLPLLLAAVTARAGLVALLMTTPYVRPGGLGEALARYAPPRTSLISAAAVTAVAAVLCGWPGFAGVLAAGGTLVAAQHAMVRRIGGTTGDTAGAAVELSETAVLIGAAAVVAVVTA